MLLSPADIFGKYNLFQKILAGTLSECQLNGKDSDQDQHFVCPDFCPNCLQRLSANDRIRH